MVNDEVALLSGFAEPIGALVAALFLKSFGALIPAAREHGYQHYTAVGIIPGAIFVFLLSGLFGV